jgi:hypothetical protein
VAIGFTGCRTSIASHQREAGHSLAEADALARAAGFAEEEIVAAKKIYVTKCAKCHKLYDPASYTDTEWESWMQKMGKKSKLKPEQYDLLARYLDTFRKKTTVKSSAR